MKKGSVGSGDAKCAFARACERLRRTFASRFFRPKHQRFAAEKIRRRRGNSCFPAKGVSSLRAICRLPKCFVFLSEADCSVCSFGIPDNTALYRRILLKQFRRNLLGDRVVKSDFRKCSRIFFPKAVFLFMRSGRPTPDGHIGGFLPKTPDRVLNFGSV